MQWGPQQDSALKAIRYWLKDDGRQVFVLFGYAGTGKSTIAKEVVDMVNGIVLFAAFTGKAAMVMRSKGCDGADTVHSLIYKPVEDGHGNMRFELNPDSPLETASLLILDECSMIDEEMGRDLLSFGTKILVLGDPAQLPPINGTGFFTHGEYKHDAILTEIHRQAADNPIIYLAQLARNGESIPMGEYGSSRVIPREALGQTTVLSADQLIVGINKTRMTWNAKVRLIDGLNPDMPCEGDKLVCLRNNKEKNFFNGSTWTARGVFDRGHSVFLTITPEDDFGDMGEKTALVRREFFHGREDEIDRYERKESDEFTYGYALTCHKSQGSQWRNIVVMNESSAFRENASRWLYTAITRAAEQIVLVHP